jgi:hypothetical protein
MHVNGLPPARGWSMARGELAGVVASRPRQANAPVVVVGLGVCLAIVPPLLDSTKIVGATTWKWKTGRKARPPLTRVA